MKNIDRIIHSKSIISSILLKIICKIQCSELPNRSKIGKGIRFPHGLKFIIMHKETTIEDNVTIFHGVTCGRGDMYNILPNAPSSEFKGIVLKSGCVICAGAKIIANRGTIVVGRNTIVGANSVLLSSTGENEIWAGNPARLIRRHNMGNS